MARFDDRRRRFRSVIDGEACVFPASTFDPVSARIAEDLGFEVGMLAGSTASQSVLAAPDYILLTLSEFAEQARRITRASTIPIMVDADHGYGNALNVARTVEELETAGICGLSIEDTDLPEPFAAGGKQRLLPIAEGLGKMRAAAAAKADPALVVAARTSAPALTGLDDTLERIRAYQESGADALFLVGVKGWDTLDAVAKVARLPVILGGVPAPMLDRAELAARGVRICLVGHHTIPAAVEAIRLTMAALKDGVSPSEIGNLADKDFLDRIFRKNEFDQMRNSFLSEK